MPVAESRSSTPRSPTSVRIVVNDVPQPANRPGEIWLRLPVRPRRYFRDDAAVDETAGVGR